MNRSNIQNRNAKPATRVQRKHRDGTALVELAFIAPVFFLMLFAILELGHVYMVIHTLSGAVREGARVGAPQGASTADAVAQVNQVFGSTGHLSHATIYVKDAATFDDPATDPTTIQYQNLNDIELRDADPLHLFVVYAEINYDDIALIPSFFLQGLPVRGFAVMRKE